MAEYRIEFSIQRADGESDEFTEIGFGSSGAWDDLDAACHSIASMVPRGEWETNPGMPSPESVMAEIEQAGT